jgi:hypothetical protein
VPNTKIGLASTLSKFAMEAEGDIGYEFQNTNDKLLSKAPSMTGIMSIAPPLKNLPDGDASKLQSKYSLFEMLKKDSYTDGPKSRVLRSGNNQPSMNVPQFGTQFKQDNKTDPFFSNLASKFSLSRGQFPMTTG